MKRKCHICNIEVNGASHWKIHKDIPKDKLKYDFLAFNFPKIKDSNLIKKLYVDCEYSLPMLCKEFGGIDLKAMSFIITYIGLHRRNSKESNSLLTVRKRIEEACLKKYGAKNSLSRNTEPYKKRNITVKDKYGVDNILQCFIDISKEYSKKQRKISKLNMRVWNILQQMGLEVIPEFTIGYLNENDMKKHWKFYDFRIVGHNILIEVNGDYWHANPQIYKPDDIVYRPFNKKREQLRWAPKAKDIWKIDEFKKYIAQVNNFNVLYLWESELKRCTNDEITKKIKDCIDRENTEKSDIL